LLLGIPFILLLIALTIEYGIPTVAIIIYSAVGRHSKFWGVDSSKPLKLPIL